MATYSRAGRFGPAAIPGAPAGVPLRVLDAAGSDAVLYADASKNKTVGPVVQSNDAGLVSFYADPGTYTVRWTGGSATVTTSGSTLDSTTPPVQASPELAYAESNVASSTTVTGATWFDVPGMDIAFTVGDNPVHVQGSVPDLDAQYDGTAMLRLLNVTTAAVASAFLARFSSAIVRPASPGVLKARLPAGVGAQRFKLQAQVASGSGTLRINSDAGTAIGTNWLQAVEV